MAAMNQVLRGTTRVGQGLRQSSNEAGLFSKQLMAIGTTARYALAGQLVFGITGAIARLQDFKNELGVIDSLAGQIDRNQNFTSLGSQLQQVAEDAILASNRVGIAVGDIEAYMQRFFSSFDVPGNQSQRMMQMNQFVDRVTQLQAMMGTEAGDPQQLAGGIAGLVNQIPGGTQNIGGNTAAIANMIAFLTRKTPNITGRDVSRDIGRVGATMTLANMTPEEAFAVWGVAGQAGGSSSVIGRGVAQLLGTALLHPNTASQKQAYAAAGLPTDPNALRAKGGLNVLLQMLQATGGSARLTKAQKAMLGAEDVSDADALTGLAGTGIDLTRIYGMLGSHQESVRQFVNILGQGGVKAMQDYIKQQRDAIKVDQQKQRFDAANRQRGLAKFSQARQNLSLSLVSAADWPIEHFLGTPTVAASNFAARHRTATQGAVATGLGIGALSALSRLTGRGKLFGKLGKMQGALAGAAISAEEIPAVLAGGATHGTRADPYWVIISPLSWTVGSPGGFMSPVIPPTGGGGWMSKLLGWGKKGAIPIGAGARALGIAGGAVAAGAALIPGSFEWLVSQMYGPSRAVPKGHPLLSKYAKMQAGMHPGDSLSIGGITGPPINKHVEEILNRFASGKLTADRAEALLRGPGSPNNPIHVQGHATLDVNINTKQPDGTTSKTRQRAHIKIIPAKSFPTKQGKAGSRKGG